MPTPPPASQVATACRHGLAPRFVRAAASRLLLLPLVLLLLPLLPPSLGAAPSPRWIFACSPTNDLYRVLSASLGAEPARFAEPADALRHAPEHAAVLLLAQGYPEQPTILDPAWLDLATRKRLRLYVEYPANLPDLDVAAPREAGLERGVVASDYFGPGLPPLRIVALSGCRYVPVTATNAPLVLARVAGVDTAVFGLADTPTQPLLFVHPRGDLLVATSRLSHFVTGRFLPSDAWRVIWQTILAELQPGAPPPRLAWTPTVRPWFSADDPLPADVERQAVDRASQWIVHSRVLRHADWPSAALEWARTYNTVRDPPAPHWPVGDGSAGLTEGFSSTIRRDGSQPMRYAVRADCLSEVAMMLAFNGALASRPEHARISNNLLDYLFQRSGLTGGPRADAASPSYGLIGWALDSPGNYWGDDNARALLALGAHAATSGDASHVEALVRGILANFRTTSVTGYREECIVEPALQARGWRSYWEASHVKHSPHFETWLWACFLWAYDQTGFAPLLQRTQTGARLLMEAYPDRWFWCIRSGSIERARALLPLAWLVRIADTPEHRGWLRRVGEDLVALQDPATGALREILGAGGHGTASNAEYGTQETTLIQTNDDPIADLLYTCNFALLGLHEAAAATGDPFYRHAEDRLAAFLCRIQIRSPDHPTLEGAWYRAFDYRRWEYWASNADWEWGPWCVETGWSQPWIASTLALRQQHTSLWDLLKSVPLQAPLSRLRPTMLPDDALAPVPVIP